MYQAEGGKTRPYNVFDRKKKIMKFQPSLNPVTCWEHHEEGVEIGVNLELNLQTLLKQHWNTCNYDLVKNSWTNQRFYSFSLFNEASSGCSITTTLGSRIKVSNENIWMWLNLATNLAVISMDKSLIILNSRVHLLNFYFLWLSSRGRRASWGRKNP